MSFLFTTCENHAKLTGHMKQVKGFCPMDMTCRASLCKVNPSCFGAPCLYFILCFFFFISPALQATKKEGKIRNVKTWGVPASTRRPTGVPSCLQSARVGTSTAAESSPHTTVPCPALLFTLLTLLNKGLPLTRVLNRVFPGWACSNGRPLNGDRGAFKF